MLQYDLHTHSTFSDGLYTPDHLVSEAKRTGLFFIGLTDHDTVDGCFEFSNALEKYDIPGIFGVEISTRFREIDLHILGYRINPQHSELIKILTKQKKARIERVKKIITLLKKAGLTITEADILKCVKNKNTNIGKPHIAQAVINNKINILLLKEKFGMNSRHPIAWFLDNFLDRGEQPGFVRKEKTDTLEAIQVIVRAGGVAVLAHPQLDVSEKTLYKIISPLIKNGLRGLEVYNKATTKDDLLKYNRLTKRYGLVETFGSDFHGFNETKLGDIKHITNNEAAQNIQRLLSA